MYYHTLGNQTTSSLSLETHNFSNLRRYLKSRHRVYEAPISKKFRSQYDPRFWFSTLVIITEMEDSFSVGAI